MITANKVVTPDILHPYKPEINLRKYPREI